MIPIKHKNAEPGFALLITILVLGVVVAVTLGLVELSLKQLKLSVDSTDSEIAFHAANAGLECAKYTRNRVSGDFETGQDIRLNCFGSGALDIGRLSSVGLVTVPVTLLATAKLYRYQHSVEWGPIDAKRCTSMDIIVMVATTSFSIGGSGGNSLKVKINGYENDTKTCDAGERCTVMSVTGFSSACNATSSPGVLKREILLEL